MKTEDADQTTLGPAVERRRAPPRPTMRVLYAAGRVLSEAHALRAGETPIGRAVDSVLGVRLDHDPRLSRHHATVVVDGDGVRCRNESRHPALRNGAPFDACRLDDGDVLQLGDTLLLYRLVPADVIDAKSPRVLGVSPEAMRLRASIELVGPTAASVLLLGPTGAGKDVAARALHEASRRRGPFVPLNVTAIPETLAESTLFGHAAGAFTGATAEHLGAFRQANGGTLFLDEIGDLPPALQPKLLRALDDKRVMPVGARESVAVDVRILTATNADIDARVQRGAFRADLHARLAEINLRLPPLAARREDILLLLTSALPSGHPPLEASLAAALVLHAWPYNVREVMKVASELAVRGAGREALTLDLVADRLRAPPRAETDPAASDEADQDEKPEDGARAPAPDRQALAALLERHGGVIADVARATGRSRKQVYRWMEQHGLREKK
jgi:DNA-binding NtrC family response regulator